MSAPLSCSKAKLIGSNGRARRFSVPKK